MFVSVAVANALHVPRSAIFFWFWSLSSTSLKGEQKTGCCCQFSSIPLMPTTSLHTLFEHSIFNELLCSVHRFNALKMESAIKKNPKLRKVSHNRKKNRHARMNSTVVDSFLPFRMDHITS